jgi:hypothetical protein
MAPLVTSTTWCPSSRRAATSPTTLAMMAMSMRPDSSVSDDVPIFATTSMTPG